MHALDFSKKVDTLKLFLLLCGSFIFQMVSAPSLLFVFFIAFVFLFVFIGSFNFFASYKIAFYLYLFFFISVLFLSSFYSHDVWRSLTRSFLSAAFFLLIFNVADFYSKRLSSGIDLNFLNGLIAGFLVVLLILGLALDGYTGGSGGFRLTGGVNANTVGFLGFVVVIWSHLSKIYLQSNKNIANFLLFLAVVVVIWSGSRTVLAALVFFYLVIISLHAFSFFLRMSISKNGLKYTFLAFFIILSSLILFLNLDYLSSYHGWFAYLESRLNYDPSSDSNLGTRHQAWSILLEYFHANPFFGGAGWFNATNILTYHVETYGLEIASSPHNGYVRVLSEVGLLGALAVYSFPLFFVFYSFFKFVKLSIRKDIAAAPYPIIIAGILAVFLREYAEDSYLTSYYTLSTFIVVFLSVFSIHISKRVFGVYPSSHRVKQRRR